MSDSSKKNSIMVPSTPNRPLSTPGDSDVFGTVSLRYNRDLEFLENRDFDPNIVCYDDEYQNNQSLSVAFKNHMKKVLNILKKNYGKRSKIVEVGCGKGDFVELVLSDGWFAIEGYDGAYEGSNPEIHKRYLRDSDSIDADIVVLRHVLEHIQRPDQFLAMLATIFGDADVYIEVPNYLWIAKEGSYFDITYEHVNYFTPKSLLGLFGHTSQHGDLFGGQYQFVLSNFNELSGARFTREYEDGPWERQTFEDLFPSFSRKVLDLQRAMPRQSSNAYVWGAATKGVMFLHHLKRMNADFFSRFRAAIDINEKKIGKFTPSTKLPIMSPEDYANCAKIGDLIVVSNPNYKDEIIDDLGAVGLTNICVVCL